MSSSDETREAKCETWVQEFCAIAKMFFFSFPSGYNLVLKTSQCKGQYACSSLSISLYGSLVKQHYVSLKWVVSFCYLALMLRGITKLLGP